MERVCTVSSFYIRLVVCEATVCVGQINEKVLIVVGASVLELARTIGQVQNLSRKGKN